MTPEEKDKAELFWWRCFLCRITYGSDFPPVGTAWHYSYDVRRVPRIEGWTAGLTMNELVRRRDRVRAELQDIEEAIDRA